MVKKNKPQTLKGFRDFLPEEMAIRQRVIQALKEVFESYGFEPLETPALEYAEVLLGKYGEEADKLVYTFKDKGGREVGLRYDLTVPVSRVLAQYKGQIPLPFKRYQIQTTWRAEKPQKARYREFTQCDIDSFGYTSPLADAEIIAIMYDCLKKLGFDKFVIKINSRQVIYDLIKKIGISQKEKQLAVVRILDKLEKLGQTKVKEELIKIKIPEDKIKKLFSLISKVKPDKNLELLFNYLKWYDSIEKVYQFDPTLVRGLDYYTGPIFEAVVEKPKIGSIAGGGRYDNLIADLGGPDIPATGVSFGLDRICDVIKDQKLWPELSLTSTKVLVTIFSLEYLEKSVGIANQLRKADIPTELYLEPETKIDKQFKYADKKGIPYVIIIGDEEIKEGKISLKDMKTRIQGKLTLKEVIQKLTV